ncbi:MAG: hypothetical protein KGY78_03595 [Anaerolineae bacterium]|nr:hypothetical protein [Anaerolineae bacterium]
MRESFKAIPNEQRYADQAFSIRVWRGLSWLERAEGAPDVEGRFISLWIAFNATYGHMQGDGLNAPDHASWQAFLAGIVEADKRERIGGILWEDQLQVLRLIDGRHLFRPFWLGQPDWQEKLDASLRPPGYEHARS